MEWRVRGGLGTAVSALVLLAGRRALTTKADRRRAGELAEKVYPGELTVVRARTLFPAGSGSEITFALRDDPDAAVRLRVDAERDARAGHPRERELRRARERAELTAAEWRALAGAFDGGGHRVLGLSAVHPTLAGPWIAASLTNASVDDVLDRVGHCLQRYADSLPDHDAAALGALCVHIAAPGAAERLPHGASGDPTLLRLSEGRLLAALSEDTYHTVDYRWDDGVLVPGSARAVVTHPIERQREFGERVLTGVAAWLSRARPGARALPVHSGLWCLRPGRVDQMRGYVLFCADPVPGRTCPGDRAALVTVDLAGRLLTTPSVLRDIRDGQGVLSLPRLT